MIIKKSIQLRTSPDELWQWLTEFARLQQWNPTLLEEKVISNGPVQSGFKSEVLILDRGKRIWYLNQILEYRPSTFLSTSLRGKPLGRNQMIVDYRIRPDGDQVILGYESRWKPSGLMLTLLHPIIKRVVTKNAENCLALLKQCIEEK